MRNHKNVSDPLQTCQYPGVAPRGQTHHLKESGLLCHSDPFMREDSSVVSTTARHKAENNTGYIVWMCCNVSCNGHSGVNAYCQLYANISVYSLSVNHNIQYCKLSVCCLSVSLVHFANTLAPKVNKWEGFWPDTSFLYTVVKESLILNIKCNTSDIWSQTNSVHSPLVSHILYRLWNGNNFKVSQIQHSGMKKIIDYVCDILLEDILFN